MKRTPWAQRTALVSWALFGLALAVRLLFWQATPDRSWPHSAVYKGDALVWADYAGALERGEQFELGLPFRPPGNAYLLRAIGAPGPEGITRGKLVWCILGALAVVLFYRAALATLRIPRPGGGSGSRAASAANELGPRVALAVGLWCALSTGLLILSTSLNNETPYLVLVGAILWLTARLAVRPRHRSLLLWGALNGLACLFRVEHLLFALLASAWVLLTRFRRPASSAARWRSLATAAALQLAAFLAVVAPWHAAAWSAIDEFNTEERPLAPAAERAQEGVERATAHLQWTPEALAERRKLPAFARRASANFVAATVLVRGGHEVAAGDFEVLEEAFGYRPEPLSAHPFVALYGPLNFYLAQRAGAPPGFDPEGLDRRPPLAGGVARYPIALLAGLPPREISAHYPPHLELFNRGYRLGWRSIRERPGEFARRTGRRLAHVWRGATLGWSGYGLPFGLAGRRQAVDLTVPEGAAFSAWGLLLLGLCAAGLRVARRHRLDRALAPWLLFALTRLAAGVLFFGYARLGATLIPVVAVLVGLAFEPAARKADLRGVRLAVAALLVGILALGTEAHRWLRPPELTLDGRPVTGRDAVPAGEHAVRRVGVR